MFDIGAGELLIIGIVALVAIKPKDLPGVLRTVGKATTKMRQMAGEFRTQFDDAMREAELEETRKQVMGIKDTVIDATTGLNPVQSIQNEIRDTTSSLKASFDGTAPVTAAPVVAEPEPKPATVPRKRAVKQVPPATIESAPKPAPRKRAAKTMATAKVDAE